MRRVPAKFVHGLTITAALVVGGACNPPEAKTPEASGSSKSNPPDHDAGKGGAEAEADEVALPTDAELIKEARGVNLTKLTGPSKTTFFQLINTELSPCNRAHSLAKSLRDDAKCRDSMIVAQFIADTLAAGGTPTRIRKDLDMLVDALTPKTIPVEGRPVYGEANAPVTVVVFADFECPHCRAEAPKIRQTIDQFNGRAKMVFKHFPLEFHVRAKQAAIACEAAHDQGKFFAMHDIVFAHPEALSDEDLERYAEQIGLDMTQYKTSLQKGEGKTRVETDHADGLKLGIGGTPTVYVNGRLTLEGLFGGSLAGWIDDALKR